MAARQRYSAFGTASFGIGSGGGVSMWEGSDEAAGQRAGGRRPQSAGVTSPSRRLGRQQLLGDSGEGSGIHAVLTMERENGSTPTHGCVFNVDLLRSEVCARACDRQPETGREADIERESEYVHACVYQIDALVVVVYCCVPFLCRCAWAIVPCLFSVLS